MGRPRKTGRRKTARKCKSGRRCKGTRRTSKKTHSAYTIPKAFACAGMRGPATSVITTNGIYAPMRTAVIDSPLRVGGKLTPDMMRPLSMKTTNSSFMSKLAEAAMRPRIGLMKTTNSGWSKQQVDDQQSSGLGFGPRPFRTG